MTTVALVLMAAVAASGAAAGGAAVVGSLAPAVVCAVCALSQLFWVDARLHGDVLVVRNGLSHRHVRTASVEAVTVGPGGSAVQSAVCLRLDDGSVVQVQAYTFYRAAAAVVSARAVASWLGVPSRTEPVQED